jgi:hypothetical protein
MAPQDYNHGHVHTTYTTLCTLTTLGDDFSRLEKGQNNPRNSEGLTRTEVFKCIAVGGEQDSVSVLCLRHCACSTIGQP